MFLRGKQFLLHKWHPPCYCCQKSDGKSWMRKGWDWLRKGEHMHGHLLHWYSVTFSELSHGCDRKTPAVSNAIIIITSAVRKMYWIQLYVVKFYKKLTKLFLFYNQQNWPPRYDQNVVEVSLRIHNPNLTLIFFIPVTVFCNGTIGLYNNKVFSMYFYTVRRICIVCLGGSRTVSYKGMFCYFHTHASVRLTKISNN